MNLNELEKNLRDFRPSHQEKINTDVLWDRVSPHIPQSKRRNNYLFIFTILFLGFVLIGLFTINTATDNRKEILTQNQSISKVENEHTTPQKEVIAENKNSVDKNKNEIKSIGSDINKIKNEKQINKSNTIIALEKNDTRKEITETEDAQIKQTSSKAQFVTEKETSRFFEESKPTNQVANINSIDNKVNNQTEKNIAKEINENIQTDNTTLTKEQKNTVSTFDVEKNNSTINANDNKAYISQKVNRTDLLTSDNTISTARQIVTVQELMQSLGFLEYVPSEPSFTPNRIHAFRYKDEPKMSIEFGGSYLSPMRTLTLTQPEFASELASRELSEEILEGWYASAAFRYHITPRFGISLGLQYGKINERSSKSLSYSETVFLEDTVIGNLVRVDGSVDPIRGDVEIDRYIMKNVSRINSYTFLQVPIELMYTQPLNRINVEFGVGIIQNISFNQTGFWHPNNQTEYDLSLDESGYLKNKLGTGITGRLGVGYDITTAVGVYANARYIHHLSGITNTNYGIDQKYRLIGAEIGLRLHLFN